jgi:hypothetical protein
MFGKKKQTADRRLYVANPNVWKVKVKDDWSKENCYHKNEGEDFFHGFVKGEIYFDSGSEKVCMNCAVKQNLLTDNRLHWQKTSGDFVEEISYEEAENLESTSDE